MKVDCTNTPAKKCKHEAVHVPMPSTESSFSELKDQTLPNNDNQFDNKKERINVKLQNRNSNQINNSNKILIQILRQIRIKTIFCLLA